MRSLRVISGSDEVPLVVGALASGSFSFSFSNSIFGRGTADGILDLTGCAIAGNSNRPRIERIISGIVTRVLGNSPFLFDWFGL
jgi:hypothetical protein